jgi:hypothetical protein
LDAEPPKAPKNKFFDLELDSRRAELTRPGSLLKTTQWGVMTVVSLLASFAFPPYFVQVLLLASLNAGGLLWVTHLTEAGRRRLREFEQEFARGHRLEEDGRWAEALQFYEAMVPRYGDFPKIADVAQKQADKLMKQILAQPEVMKAAKSVDKSKKPKAPKKTAKPRSKR